jgi:DNA-binding NarL/FixJ family response regulator
MTEPHLAKIRVMLVDDQSLLRVGLKTILNVEDDMTVVAEASSGSEAIALLDGARPDVILMDIQMPGMDGIEATSLITQRADHPAVVILTTFHREDYLFGALRAGAVGFVLKTSPPERITDAIRTAAAGNAMLAPELTMQVITAAVRNGQASADPQAAQLFALLTEREREVLNLTGKGSTNAEIGAALYIGEATVRTHLTSVFSKLGVNNRVNAVVWAYRNGFIE